MPALNLYLTIWITSGGNDLELVKAGWTNIHHFQIKLSPEDDSYCKAPSMYNPMLNRTHYLNERLFAFEPLKDHIAGISLTSRPRLKLIASYLTFDDGTGRRKYALKGWLKNQVKGCFGDN